MQTKTRLLTLLTLGASLYGCATTQTDPSTPYRGQTAEQIFISAEACLAKGNNKTAAEKFEALDAIYPCGQYAQRAQLDIIYAYYRSNDMPSAACAAERYIRQYPAGPHADYAYYIKGISNFEQDRGFLQRYIRTDLAERDPGSAREAFNDFKQLICSYPDSCYAPDARERMIYLRNLLARYEMNIAIYYFNRRAYVAAINRASNVLEHYEQSPSVCGALKLMRDAYLRLCLPEQAKEAEMMLHANFR
jgi:outer membrane protein assembly factor BamD